MFLAWFTYFVMEWNNSLFKAKLLGVISKFYQNNCINKFILLDELTQTINDRS